MNSKYDAQLNRMMDLMNYEAPKSNLTERTNNIEYHTVGADGKVYGILKENNKYYIKTTTQGKEMISESYDYINGFTHRSENAFTDYNKATKHLELQLMSLNEAYGANAKVSTVNFNKQSEDMKYLTEEARKELNRINQIMENSAGIIEDPESKGKAMDPKKQGYPYGAGETPKAELDKDFKKTATLQNAVPDTKKVTNAEAELTGDQKHAATGEPVDGYKKTTSDIKGKDIAAEKKSGKNPVGIYESIFEDGEDPEYDEAEEYGDGEGEISPEDAEFEDGGVSLENAPDPVEDDDESDIAGMPESEEEIPGNIPEEGYEDEDEGYDDEDDFSDVPNLNGYDPDEEGNKEEEMDSDWEDLRDTNQIIREGEEEDSKSTAFKGPKGNGKSVTMAEAPGAHKAKDGGYAAFAGPKGHGAGETMKRVNEITNKVMGKILSGKLNETLQEKIDRIVNEEITRLNVWGQHPGYRKKPMSTPANTDVMKGTADRDINDASAKGEQPFGQKIGSSFPYTEKVVNLITDQVLSQLKESLLKKK